MFDSLTITLFTYQPLHTEPGLAALLDALGSVPGLEPTHWGPDGRTRSPFDRDRMIAEVSGYQSEFYVPVLRRRKAPACEAFFSAKSSGLNYVEINFSGLAGQADAARFFTLGDFLVDALAPELAFVHPIWRRGEESQLYSASGVLPLKELQAFGLNPICARTWYGPRLVGSIGRERLTQAGLAVENMRWGGVRADLTADPSNSDFETLQRRQTEAMRALARSGLYADYTRFNDFVPGPHWVPFPLVRGVVSTTAAEPADTALLARLRAAIVEKEAVTGLDLTGADLRGADLSYLVAVRLVAERARFDGALLNGADLVEAYFTESVLDEADLAGAAIGMATFDRASLRGADLRNTLFTIAFCSDADLTDADLSGADVSGTSFYRSRFDRASLRRIKAGRAGFSGASLQNADLTDAGLRGADCSGADFRGAILAGVQWADARLDGALFDSGAEPAGFR